MTSVPGAAAVEATLGGAGSDELALLEPLQAPRSTNAARWTAIRPAEKRVGTPPGIIARTSGGAAAHGVAANQTLPMPWPFVSPAALSRAK
jgi:hypothetical protein